VGISGRTQLSISKKKTGRLSISFAMAAIDAREGFLPNLQLFALCSLLFAAFCSLLYVYDL
jgi:hypothetical protein